MYEGSAAASTSAAPATVSATAPAPRVTTGTPATIASTSGTPNPSWADSERYTSAASK